MKDLAINEYQKESYRKAGENKFFSPFKKRWKS